MTSFRYTPSELSAMERFSHSDGGMLFLSASYEERCLGLAQHLPSSAHFNMGLVYVNEEFLTGPASERTRKNLETLEAALKKHCDHVEKIVGSWLDPVKQVTVLRKLSDIAAMKVSVSPQCPICIDSTTFTRESLLVTCALLCQNGSAVPLRIFYTSPEKHGEWLSRGFREVRNIMGFPGVQSPGAPTSLIILSGFEPDRICRLIEAYEPSKVFLGIGNPATEDIFLKRNIDEQRLILARQEVHRFEFSATSVTECASKLQTLIDSLKHTDNIILAPMCTKLSTIASFLVAERDHSIQLVYAVPGEYNLDSYSGGVKAIYSEDIALP